MKKVITVLFITTLLVQASYAQNFLAQLDFSEGTPGANSIQVKKAGFGSYPLAGYSFDNIPKDNAFPGATDGQGMIITADPGEGIMVLTQPIQTPNCALLRCSVRVSAPHTSIYLASIDQGEDQFVSTITANNPASFVGQYNRIADFFLPPSTGFQGIIQFVNTSETEPLTVYIDNFEIIESPSDKIEYNIDDIKRPDIQATPTPISTPTPSSITISGFVRSLIGSTPISEAMITIGNVSTTSDVDGAYSITLPKPGTYNILVEAHSYSILDTTVEFITSQEYNIKLRPSSPGATPTPTLTYTPTPTFTLTPTPLPGNIYGLVYHVRTLEPIIGAEVEIGSLSTITDESGSYMFNNAPGGNQKLTVTAEGYVEETRFVNIRDSIDLNVPMYPSSGDYLITVDLPDLPPNSTPLEMVYIEPGTFMMGSPSDEEDRDDDEGPVHQVTLTQGFYIGKYEVTQSQYEAVMNSNPSYFDGTNNPVENVSWYDAVRFCNRLSEIKGLQPVYTESGDWEADMSANGYRLPTEAEWEYACRAGTQTRFYWGDDPNYNQIDDYAWYGDNSSRRTHEVGQKLPNAWGLYDMSGNVWEWCSDWYGDYPYGDQVDPKGKVSGSFRVGRGGSWLNSPRYVRSAFRGRYDPTDTGIGMGFRVIGQRTN